MDQHGLFIIAMDNKALTCTNISMHIDLYIVSDETRSAYQTWIAGPCLEPPNDQSPKKRLIVANDLPAFCTSLLKTLYWQDRVLIDLSMVIRVNSSICIGLAGVLDSSTSGRWKLRQILEPFYLLNGLDSTLVHVDGPISSEYKNSVKATICREEPSPTEVFESISVLLDKGEKAEQEHNFSLAIEKYRNGLNLLHTAHPEGPDTVITSGRLAGIFYRKAWRYTSIRFQALLAACYLKLKQYRMALIWTERGLDGVRDYDAQRKRMMRYNILIDPDQYAIYAESSL